MAQFGEFFASECRRSTRSVWRWKRPLRSICHKQCVVRPANGSGRSGANTRPKREDRATGSAQGGKWENSVSWVQHVNFNVELMSVLVHSKSILVYGQKLNCLSASRQEVSSRAVIPSPTACDRNSRHCWIPSWKKWLSHWWQPLPPKCGRKILQLGMKDRFNISGDFWSIPRGSMYGIFTYIDP